MFLWAILKYWIRDQSQPGLNTCENLSFEGCARALFGWSQSKPPGKGAGKGLGVQTELVLRKQSQARLVPRALTPPAARLWGERHWE